LKNSNFRLDHNSEERPQPLDENVVEEAAAPVHRDADAGPFERPVKAWLVNSLAMEWRLLHRIRPFPTRPL
jgi:hypothetical protein